MAEATFSRRVRLLDAQQYKAVFDDAPFRVSTRELLFLSRPNSLPVPRLGLVISKKSCRLAVQRNRVKRLVRESFRQHQGSLTGLDIIVLSRRGIAELDNHTLTQLITQSWTRLLKRSQTAAPGNSDASSAS
ncbi:MAG: ribonuclease P protein component [Gammaproteobacteria bacterium]|jgi:ribonuclease P protein component|nr:ribonuclease P protein component [Gammaproteobacteria bacterium]MBP6051858.1 ribonuclease P protein component [Pseudomonadales bacterium]MBK6582918.1 ribonuclease P protein component [Gammaproteobacteria bacterium]MBK7168193.1 ribonuclease P protein component [Gammaproteobacteria bacterium]MBK7519048.1 ribonuclease P protein component [Gammaproteobacteria bacterium]